MIGSSVPSELASWLWLSQAERGHGSLVESAAYSGDGSRIATVSDDCTARIWDTANGAEIARVVLDASVTAARHARRDTLALGDALGRVHIFEIIDPALIILVSMR